MPIKDDSNFKRVFLSLLDNRELSVLTFTKVDPFPIRVGEASIYWLYRLSVRMEVSFVLFHFIETGWKISWC